MVCLAGFLNTTNGGTGSSFQYQALSPHKFYPWLDRISGTTPSGVMPSNPHNPGGELFCSASLLRFACENPGVNPRFYCRPQWVDVYQSHAFSYACSWNSSS